MSTYYNDYIIASNNSINENKYNSEKLAKSPSYRIKKILKPILRILRQKNKNNRNHEQSAGSSSASNTNNKVVNYSMESASGYGSSNSSQNYYHDDYYQQQNDFWSSEIDDNFANEELESRIFNEIEQCNDDAAIYVYNDDECAVQAVHRQQTFIPVHFARTEAGTFFWTTMQKPVIVDDEDDDVESTTTSHCCGGYNLTHCGDRWVQA